MLVPWPLDFGHAFSHANGKLDNRRKALANNEKSPPPQMDDGLLVSSNRGDKTAIELFVAAVACWCSAIREYFIDITPPSTQGL
jgi:hypothetical protein